MNSTITSAVLTCLCILTAVPTLGQAPPYLLGKNSGVVDLTQQPYSLIGDGKTDNTKAFQAAISDYAGTARILLLPAGTYMVSDSLLARNAQNEWMGDLIIRGSGVDQTIIRLRDEAEGFSDAKQLKPVLMMASYNREQGTGNTAFNNYLYDLTIDVGRGNPGAVALDYIGNNIAGIYRIKLRAPVDSGAIGLAMTRTIQGPCLMKQVTVEGFDEGVRIGPAHAVTFEDVNLSGYRKAGLVNAHRGSVSVRKLIASGLGPAVVNEIEPGLVVILDSHLSQGGGVESFAPAAIVNRGRLYARNVTTAGFKASIDSFGEIQTEKEITEFSSDPINTLGPAQSAKFQLTAEDTPAGWSDGGPDSWVNVAQYGAAAGDEKDDSAALQAALDSGKSIIYFPRTSAKKYLLTKTFSIPAHVRRIDFGFSEVLFAPAEEGVSTAFLIEEPSAHPLELVNLALEGDAWTSHEGPRDVVMRNIAGFSLRNGPGAGKLFIENVAGSRMTLTHSQNVWARQLNAESRTFQNLMVNNGGNLWILGYKTEMPFLTMQVLNAAKTEILGGELYPVILTPELLPALLVDNATLAFSLNFKASPPSAFFRELVHLNLGGEVQSLRYDQGDYVTEHGTSVARAVAGGSDEDTQHRLQHITIERSGSASIQSGETETLTYFRRGNIGEPLELKLRWECIGGVTNDEIASLPASVRFPANVSQQELRVPTPRHMSNDLPGAIVCYPQASRDLILDLPRHAVINIDPNQEESSAEDRSPAGLVLWLRADRGIHFNFHDPHGQPLVARWIDQSGSGNDAMEDSPYYQPVWIVQTNADRPAISFSQSHLRFADSRKTNDLVAPSGQKTIVLSFATGEDVHARQIIWEQGYDRAGINIYLDQGKLYAGAYNYTGYDGTEKWGSAFTSFEVEPNSAYRVVAILDAESKQFRMYLDGSGWQTSAQPAGKLPLLSRSFWPWSTQLGANHSMSLFRFHDNQTNPRFGLYFTGTISEVMEYTRALSTDETRAVMVTLHNRF